MEKIQFKHNQLKHFLLSHEFQVLVKTVQNPVINRWDFGQSASKYDLVFYCKMIGQFKCVCDSSVHCLCYTLKIHVNDAICISRSTLVYFIFQLSVKMLSAVFPVSLMLALGTRTKWINKDTVAIIKKNK